MRICASFLIFVLLGCAPTFEKREWAALPLAERQKAVNELTQKCGLPADRLTILEGDEVRLKPHPNDPYEAIDCLLGGLKSLYGIRLGFVGNEAFKNEGN